MATALPQCKPTDQPRFRPQRSCSKKNSALAMGFQRLSDNTHIRNAGLLHSIHDGGESAKGNVFIGTNENGLVPGIANLLPQLVADFVDIDRIVSEKHPLFLIDAYYQPLLGDFLNAAGLGNIYLDA